MKREIKFRGFNEKNNKWLYGDLIHNRGLTFVCPVGIADPFETWKDFVVETESVGQFTGLHDCNGKEIYEGDIIKTPRGNIGMVIFGKAEETVTHYVFRRKVTDVYTTYGWVFERINDGYRCAIDDSILDGNCIGNIHDNPELIERKSNE